MVESSAARLDSVFHALSDPTRRAILRGLTSGERTVTEIAQPHRMTLAAVSKHLKVLEAAELVARERRGSFHIVRLHAQSLKPAEEWIAFYSRFWNERSRQPGKVPHRSARQRRIAMSTAVASPEPTMPATAPRIHLTRFFRAPRERVFAAWTNPDQLTQWMGPAGFTCTRAESDPRPGGRHHVTMRGPSTNCSPDEPAVTRDTSTSGEYLEVNPPELIRFTWNPSFFPDEHTIVTVRLKEVPGGTELELLHEGFISTAAAEGHNRGWNGCLDKLAAFIER